MILRQILAAMGILIVVSTWGCATPDRARTWVDLSEISAQIEKPEKLSSELDVAEDAAGEGPQEPRVQDLSAQKDGQNSYLRGLKAPPPPGVAKEGAEEGILLNFDNADIYEFIQIITAALDMNYIVDPQVKGVVNIRSGVPIARDQLFVLFKKILNINGLDLSFEGDYYYISVAKKPTPQRIYGPGQIGDLKSSPKVVTQIAPVVHLSANEAVKLLEPYLSPQGSIFTLENQNTLIIHDYESKVLDAMLLLASLDVSPLSSLRVRLVRVENASLFELRDELEEVLAAMRVNKKDFSAVTVLPLERVNSLLLVSESEYLLDRSVNWITELDKVPTGGRDNIYIYNVRNSVASDLSDLVTALISGEGTVKKSSSTSTETKGPTATPQPAAQPRPRTTTQSSAKKGDTLRFSGEPTLLADDTRNVILIRALPVDYKRILKLLERLDNLPRQVLIEVLVAEVTLTDEWQFGVEWALQNKELKINGSQYTQNFVTNFEGVSVPGANVFGFTYSVLNSAGDVNALLNALASKTDVALLSSPQVLVLNNETAMVNVGDQVPIVTTETQQQGVDIPTVDRTVQYRDTGTILNVTPKINANGIIILDVDQQVSVAVETKSSGINSPTISNRQVKTKLAIKDGQAILIGGLIRKDGTVTETGIPLLKDIPALGWLFKSYSDTSRKTELLVLITPYVIESEDVLDQYVQKFKKKMGELKKELAKKKKTAAGE